MGGGCGRGGGGGVPPSCVKHRSSDIIFAITNTLFFIILGDIPSYNAILRTLLEANASITLSMFILSLLSDKSVSVPITTSDERWS